MFEDKTKPRANQRPLECIKSVDPIKFPPCKKVVEQQIRRAWYVSKLYKTATEAYPVNEFTPIDFGWKLSECGDYLEMNWFEGEQIPSEVESTNSTDQDTDEREEDNSDSDQDESDESESENEYEDF